LTPANDTTEHYAAIHCWRQQAVGPAVQRAEIPPPQSATLGLHPYLLSLFISHPQGSIGELAWPLEYTIS